MERYEKINKIMAPMDAVLGQGFDLLRKANLYDPFKKGVRTMLTSGIKMNLKMANSLEVYGTENIPLTGGVILASNHQSWLDAQAITVSAPRDVSFVAKSEFVDWPFLRHLIDLSDSVFINRTGDNQGIGNVVELLKGGRAICIFPEGTIPGEENIPRWDVDPETGLLRGKTGAVRLALQSGVPIIPVGCSGTGRAFPPEVYPRMQQSPLSAGGKVVVRFGEPIHLSTRDGKMPSYEEIRGMTDKLMKAISHLVDHSMNYEPITLPLTRKTAPTRMPQFPYRSKPRPKSTRKAPLGVLVLHGFTAHVDCVADLRFDLDELDLPYRIPWLRGHGTRFQDLKGVKASDWYEDAEDALLDLLGECNKVVIVGHSMGGLVAMDLAAHYRKETAGLVAAAPALKFKDPLAPATKAVAKVVPSWPSPNSYVDLELKKMRNRNYPKFPTEAFVELFDYAAEVANRLSFIETPALLLQPRNDQIVAPASSTLALKKISSREKNIEWLEESGHELYLDLEAMKARTITKDFIAGIIARHQEAAEAFKERVTTEAETKVAPKKTPAKAPAKAPAKTASKAASEKKTTTAETKTPARSRAKKPAAPKTKA